MNILFRLCLTVFAAVILMCGYQANGQETVGSATTPSASGSTSDRSDDDDSRSSTELRRKSVSSDPDAPGPLTFQLTPELSFGAKLSLELRPSDDLDLNESADDHLVQGTAKLRLSLLYEPHRLIDIYTEVEWKLQDPLSDGNGERSTEEELTLRRAYLLWREFLVQTLSLQFGRQRFSDDRQWLFDENLDAVRLKWEQDKFSAELSVAELLFEPVVFDDRPRSFKDEEALQVVLSGRYQYDEKERVTGFAVFRQDGRRETDLAWVGGSWRGRLKRHKIWVDASGLLGQDRGQEVWAHAIDAGITLRYDVPWKPSFTFATAYGSGDSEPRRGHDLTFRQTGLQDNEWRFNGLTKFKYYGEVVDPELSNLVITTAAFGVLPIEKLSVDLVYHYYAQAEKFDELRHADIEEHLTGKSRDIGHAVDLIFGYRIGDKIRGSVLGGCFFPGDAFEQKDTAFAGKLTLQIAF
ncbi:MAG: alginate export family protein [Chthoniobacterales bacterium]